MVTKNTILPYDGKPKTSHGVDGNSVSVFTIKTKELTPVRAKIADWLAILTVAFFISLPIIRLYIHHKETEFVTLGLVFYFFAVFGFPLFSALWRFNFKKEVKIMLTAELFMVEHWSGWKRYNRTLAHSFFMIPHDKAKKEAEKIDLDIQRGHASSRTRYYSDSYHLCYSYAGTRHDIVTVMGHKEASAILARLTLCDETINAQTGMGDGIPLSPADQWNNSGDIA